MQDIKARHQSKTSKQQNYLFSFWSGYERWNGRQKHVAPVASTRPEHQAVTLFAEFQGGMEGCVTLKAHQYCMKTKRNVVGNHLYTVDTGNTYHTNYRYNLIYVSYSSISLITLRSINNRQQPRLMGLQLDLICSQCDS